MRYLTEISTTKGPIKVPEIFKKLIVTSLKASILYPYPIEKNHCFQPNFAIFFACFFSVLKVKRFQPDFAIFFTRFFPQTVETLQNQNLGRKR
jgi:hypothetical protein